MVAFAPVCSVDTTGTIDHEQLVAGLVDVMHVAASWNDLFLSPVVM
jgi:hypothetical protein